MSTSITSKIEDKEINITRTLPVENNVTILENVTPEASANTTFELYEEDQNFW